MKTEQLGKSGSATVAWVGYAVLVSLGISAVVDLVVITNPALVVSETRTTALFQGALTLLALVISVGALTYVEFLGFATNLYGNFVETLSDMVTRPELSGLTPPQARELYEKFGAEIPDKEFLSQPTWGEIAKTTQKRIKEVNDVIEKTFYGLVIVSGFGIVITLLYFLIQVVLAQVLASLDLGITSVVFFGFLLYLFTTARRSSFELLPLGVVARVKKEERPQPTK